MSTKKILNEYEAAATVGMSPTLLRWFTKYAPKSGDPRKLKIEKEEKDVVFFEEQELLSFNEWLRLPWPHPPGKRPGMPTGIRTEIKVEANGSCALCQSNGDSCEAAHLDPVSKTECNHPEGLLWLCATHHTKYDNGRYGPHKEDAEFVHDAKRFFYRHKRMLWVMQDEVGRKLFLLLDECAQLEQELKKAKTAAQRKTIEAIATEALAELPKLAPVSHVDRHYEAYKTISSGLSSLQAKGGKAALSARLKQATKIKREYVAALGYVVCPLCKASGYYDGADGPVCGGDREIEADIAAQVDLSEYEKVRCPLCKGDRKLHGEDCPECGGEGEMQRRFADRVDVGQYKKVKCPLCKGNGKYDGEDCPECQAEGEMPRYAADLVDINQYRKVKCPLCKGEGRFDGDDCPVCEAEGEIQRHAADQVDLGQYKKVPCPLCKGGNDDCPFCDGEGEVYRGDADRFDPSEYKR